MGIKNKKHLLFILFIFIMCTVFSHPHMWFTSNVEFIFSEKKIAGVYVTWTFDRFFSSDIITGYDMNKDGKFDADETADVYENAFTYTSNYYYFTFIRNGKDRVSPDHVEKSNFSVWQKDGILRYKFYVDLNKLDSREIYFACYDYTFFCDITYPEVNPVKFVYNSYALNPKYEIIENKNYPVYYDPLSPIEDTRVYFKWKPGLNTYYPKEIKVTF